MSCPEGQYYCHDRGKCMPIPKGKKVRKDGELVSEVAPPGFGHTKSGKGDKKGGTAAAFKRALDRGDFKGLPGDKTKKDKVASMFKIMWSQKKKGDKPHYKPGTDKKYKKYQEDWKPEVEVVDTKKRKKDAEKKRKEAADSLPPHLKLDVMKKAFSQEDAKYGYDKKGRSLNPKDIKKRNKQAEDKYEPNKPAIEDWVSGHSMGPTESLSMKDSKKLAKASVLSSSDDPKDQDRARARQTEIDYKDLIRQRKKGKVGVGKSMQEGKSWKQWKTAAKAALGKKTPKHDYGRDAGAEAAKRLRKKDHEKVNFLDPED